MTHPACDRRRHRSGRRAGQRPRRPPRALTELLETHPGPLLLPATGFTEVCLLLERRRGTQAELAFLADVRAGWFRLVDDLEPDLDRIAELVERYADLPLGTVDASVVELTERLGLHDGATLDHRDFSVVRPRHTPALTLLS